MYIYILIIQPITYTLPSSLTIFTMYYTYIVMTRIHSILLNQIYLPVRKWYNTILTQDTSRVRLSMTWQNLDTGRGARVLEI